VIHVEGWERIWAVCPELRPDHLCFPGPQDGECWNLAGDGGQQVFEITDDTAAALIRDKAVWWLANWFGGWDSISSWVFMQDDPTEALYLACCKVLGVTP